MAYLDNVTTQIFPRPFIEYHNKKKTKISKFWEGVYLDGFDLEDDSLSEWKIEAGDTGNELSITFTKKQDYIFPGMVLQFTDTGDARVDGRWRVRAITGDGKGFRFFTKKSVNLSNPLSFVAPKIRIPSVGLERVTKTESGYEFFYKLRDVNGNYLGYYNNNSSYFLWNNGLNEEQHQLQHSTYFWEKCNAIIGNKQVVKITSTVTTSTLFNYDDNYTGIVDISTSSTFNRSVNNDIHHNMDYFISNNSSKSKLFLVGVSKKDMLTPSDIPDYSLIPLAMTPTAERHDKTADKNIVTYPWVTTTYDMSIVTKIPGLAHFTTYTPTMKQAGLHYTKYKNDPLVNIFYTVNDYTKDYANRPMIIPLSDEFYVLPNISNQDWD